MGSVERLVGARETVVGALGSFVVMVVVLSEGVVILGRVDVAVALPLSDLVVVARVVSSREVPQPPAITAAVSSTATRTAPGRAQGFGRDGERDMSVMECR